MTNNEHFGLEPQEPIAQPPYVAPAPVPQPETPVADAPTERFAPAPGEQTPTQVFATSSPQGTETAGPKMFATVPGTSLPAQTAPVPSPFAAPSAGAQPVGGNPSVGFGAQMPTQHNGFAATEGSRNTTPATKQRSTGAIITAAALAAVLASGGTAGLLLGPLSGQFGNNDQQSVQGPAQNDQGATSQKVSNSTSENPDWQAVSSAVAPTVVAIGVTTNQGQGQGSGVVMDASGYVLTNNHVVEGAKNDTVTVTLNDGSLHQAKIVGLDAATDLAVIKLIDPPADLVAAPFADSNEVEVGQAVMAMGNPLGLSQTATTGIVSAIDRPVSTARTGDGTLVVTNAIQIDAAVNPGNSGGPLFNANGEVIGITSSIATTSRQSGTAGSIGLGFAIPANLAQQIGSQLKDNGSAQHAFLGVAMTDGTATANGKTQTGAVVQEVTADSPAAAAGIEKGDVIVSIAGKNVTGSEFLTGAVREKSAGDTVTVGVVRGSELKEIKVTLAQKKESATSVPQEQQDPRDQQQDPTNPNNLPDLGQLFPGLPGQGN